MSSIFWVPGGTSSVGADPLIERGARGGRVGIARRERHGGERRDVLHQPADALLVGAHPVGHRDRRVDPGGRGRARRIGAGLAGVPADAYRPACRRPARSRCRTADRRRAAADRVEEIVGGRHRRGRRQRGAGELADRRGQRALQIGGGRVAVAPMVNSFGPGVAEVVAVSVMLSLEPSGSVKRNWMVSPAFGLTAPRSTGRRRRRAGRAGHGRAGQASR